jgi:recombination protein RecR
MPGIGPKTALRLVYHLMKRPTEDALRLSQAIRDLADRIRPCGECGSFSEGELCEVCADPGRDSSIICVVEEAYEVGAIERTGRYQGLYHVLGGHLSPLDGIGPDELNLPSLLDRIGRRDGEVREVIVATNASVEGEATAVYLENLIRPSGPRVTRLARGIPVGSDLEYVDGTRESEMKRALKTTGIVLLGVAAASALAALVVRDQLDRNQRELFSPSPLKRLACLGHMARADANVDNITLLRDFVAWESRKLLRNRAQVILKRMERQAVGPEMGPAT